jgi:hypothetical protein
VFTPHDTHKENVNCPENVADDCNGDSAKCAGPLVRFAFEGGPALVGGVELRFPAEPEGRR